MKKVIVSFMALMLILLFSAGCTDIFAGNAASPFSNGSDSGNSTASTSITTTTRDELTAKFNKIVKGIDSDQSQEQIIIQEIGPSTTLAASTTTSSTLPATTTLAPSASTTTTTTLPEGPVVTIKDSAINPVELYINAGETVVWINKEAARVHMISSLTTQEFRSPRMMPGETFQHTFSTPGTYDYYDAIKAEDMNMRGKIVVS